VSKQGDVVFFIDWSISQRSVPDALRAAGATVETHLDHFPSEAADVDWLPAVSERGWIVLTKDEAIGRRPNEVAAIANAGARVFILASGNLTREQMANLFVAVLEKLEKFSRSNPAPFIAKVYKDGKIQLWRNRTQLLKVVRQPGL
jgi:predicted nuclease of predicted toxin-antitoxin system